MSTLRIQLLFILVTFLSVSCTEDYSSVESLGEKYIKDVQKYDSFFDQTNHEIGTHHGILEDVLWRSRGIVYGRYISDMTFNISITNGVPHKTSGVKIFVMEYCSDGAFGRLTDDEWNEVKTVEEFFEKLQIVPVKDKPIKNIDNHLKY